MRRAPMGGAGEQTLAQDSWRGPAEALAEAIGVETDLRLRSLLLEAARRLGEGEYLKARALALTAAAQAPRSLAAHRLVGLASEGCGDLAAALGAFQAAYELNPSSSEGLGDLGRLAMTMGLPAAAAAFFNRALAAEAEKAQTSTPPRGSAALIAQFCEALRESGGSEAGLQGLRAALTARPDNLLLQSALASALLQDGATLEALALAQAILTLEPQRPEALYARALARFELGDLAAAEADCTALLAEEAEGGRAATRFLRAQTRLALGDLMGGWRDYEARLDPLFPGAPCYDLPIPRWSPGEPLAGRKVLVVGEQGIGDEIMFASMIPDLVTLTGAGAAPGLAASPRLADLFQRSFPTVAILELDAAARPGQRRRVEIPGAEAFDVFTPVGSLAAQLRAEPAAFAENPKPGARRSLRPDPRRVEYWRQSLYDLGPGLKVGVSWKSARTSGHRAKLYPPLSAWRPVFTTPGVTFVTLQYGEVAEDLVEARRLGAELWSPPGLNLTQDLDDAAALSAALDLAIGVANASTGLAAAAATPTWFILPRAAWPTLGQTRHPWFADTRLFQASGFDGWPQAFAAAAAALGRTAASAAAAKRH